MQSVEYPCLFHLSYIKSDGVWWMRWLTADVGDIRPSNRPSSRPSSPNSIDRSARPSLLSYTSDHAILYDHLDSCSTDPRGSGLFVHSLGPSRRGSNLDGSARGSNTDFLVEGGELLSPIPINKGGDGGHEILPRYVRLPARRRRCTWTLTCQL